MAKVLIIDNYDSFTFNLVHYVEGIINKKVTVLRNDEFELEEIDEYSHIILSPGPGLPADTGQMNALIKRYATSKSIFGVCLGMQAIAEHYGARLENLEEVYHGVATTIKRTREEMLFDGMPSEFDVGRYHSWIIQTDSLPDELETTSIGENNRIMSIRHKTHNVRGVQFHPESILTPLGKTIVENYLNHY
jgi:anthranilate synthase component II